MDLIKACFEVLRNHPVLYGGEEEGLSEEKKSEDDDVKNALERLTEVVDNVDNAQNLKNFEWIAVFQKILGLFPTRERDSAVATEAIISRACEVIAIAASNDEKMQEECLGVLPHVLSLLKRDGMEDEVIVKSLYALSSIVQENGKTCGRFIGLKGTGVVIEVMKKQCRGRGLSVEEEGRVKILIKALVLVRNCSFQDADVLSDDLLQIQNGIMRDSYEELRRRSEAIGGAMLTLREVNLRLFMRFKSVGKRLPVEGFREALNYVQGNLINNHRDELLDEMEMLKQLSSV